MAFDAYSVTAAIVLFVLMIGCFVAILDIYLWHTDFYKNDSNDDLAKFIEEIKNKKSN